MYTVGTTACLVLSSIWVLIIYKSWYILVWFVFGSCGWLYIYYKYQLIELKIKIMLQTIDEVDYKYKVHYSNAPSLELIALSVAQVSSIQIKFENKNHRIKIVPLSFRNNNISKSGSSYIVAQFEYKPEKQFDTIDRRMGYVERDGSIYLC